MKLKRIIIVLMALLIALPSLRAQDDAPMQITGSRKAVRTSTDVMLGVMPAATLAIAIAKKDWNGIWIGAAECAGTFAVTYGLKYVIHKKRPDGSDNHSFPSGHTALAFADASFVMRRYGWKFGVPMYAAAGYVAWGRTYAKKHDFWDVAAGAAIGAAVGLIATTPFMKEHDVKLTPELIETPTPDGGSFVTFGVGGSVTF